MIYYFSDISYLCEKMGTTIIVIIVVILAFFILEYNVCVSLRNKVKQSKSSIDVYLNQRFDLIPNLVECVKAYQIYEEKILNELVEERNRYKNTQSIKEANTLNSNMMNIVVTAEANPNIKASEQYKNLQSALIRMESQLQAARRIYNGDVTLYNTSIASFPRNIVASIFGFEYAELFEIEEYKKEINVNFKENDK